MSQVRTAGSASGPEFTFAARGDQRTVTTADSAGMFAAAPGDVLIAKEDAILAPTAYREWLDRQA
ncbi:NmrA family transcriptional regulator [Micromonospora sp. NPDC005189]|uniref:NmrA family transcriptional regulator n=1 Tax=unclassified Micromonospora TaxID=2617518 RepID=UPI0033A12932